MKMSNIGIEPGDRIITPLFTTGLSKHHAVYLGADQFGQNWVAENSYGKGVRVVDAKEYFSRTRMITRIEKFIGTEAQKRTLLYRAAKMQGYDYDLLDYNCEHFANELIYGTSESKQVKNAVMLAIVILLALGVYNVVKYG
jgi:hypothetical protein